jgi:O-methyltransferase
MQQVNLLRQLDLADKQMTMMKSIGYVYGSRVEGDIIEFGTASGETSSILAQSMLCAENEFSMLPRNLFLFDSFEGFPELEELDKLTPHAKDGIWTKGTCKGLSEQELFDLIHPLLGRDRVFIHAGWFKDTVDKNLSKNQLFSVIHVDCDLYQSTIDALTPLFKQNRISKGAMILFDDWNCNSADNDFGQRLAWKHLSREFNIISENMGSYTWSANRFLIQGYNGN